MPLIRPGRRTPAVPSFLAGPVRQDVPPPVEARTLPLRRVVPHAPFNEREAADHLRAIEAHARELEARLGRDVGLSVAALDYLLNLRGELVAPAIVEREVLELLEHRAVTDPVTGLFNRHHFDATLHREVARSKRAGARLSLLLVDVDQLKAVNDAWGHRAGDLVLGHVAAGIRNTLRASDIGSRYGGDEFAIILPDTDVQVARIVADRICKQVETSFDEGVGPHARMKVTVSGGLAELPPTAASLTAADLVGVADQALYLAKHRGGNCVSELAADPAAGAAVSYR